MKVYQLQEIEIQTEVQYCYYDYEKEERIFITREEAEEKEIRYMYVENNEIFIEVESDT